MATCKASKGAAPGQTGSPSGQNSENDVADFQPSHIAEVAGLPGAVDGVSGVWFTNNILKRQLQKVKSNY